MQISQSIIPYAAAGTAPIAPAAVVAFNVHHELSAMLAAWSFAPDAVPWLSAPVAIGAAVSLELAGAAICKTALDAWRRKLRIHAAVAGFGAVAYTGLVVWAIRSVEAAQVFTPFAGLSLLAYIGLALYSDAKQAHVEQLAAQETRVQELTAEAELVKAQAALIRAQAKAQAPQVAPQIAPQPVADPPQAAPVKTWDCDICVNPKRTFTSQQALAAHKRWHKLQQEQGKVS